MTEIVRGQLPGGYPAPKATWADLPKVPSGPAPGSRPWVCPHCGLGDVTVTRDGRVDRHRRADWQARKAPANELCAGEGREAS